MTRAQVLGGSVRVAASSRREPAFYVADRLVAAPPNVPGIRVLAPPVSGAMPPTLEAAYLSLLLPVASGSVLDFASSPLAGFFHVPWTRTDDSVWLPAEVAGEELFRRGHPVRLIASPDVVYPEVPPRAMTNVAWRVLRRVPASVLASALAPLAFSLEFELLAGHGIRGMIERELGCEGHGGRRFRGLLARGDLPMDPRCLRWIIGEAARSSFGGCWFADGDHIHGDSDEFLVAGLFFDDLRQGKRPPSLKDLLRALWLLHAEFSGSPLALDGVLPMLAMLAYQGPRGHGRLFGSLDEARSIWAMADSHPSMRAANPTGQHLRSLVTDSFGIEPERWLGGVLMICSMLIDRAGSGLPPVLKSADLADAHTDFTNAFDEEFVLTFEELGRELDRTMPIDAGPHEVAIATAVALRERPFIRAGATYFCTSLAQVADRGVARLVQEAGQVHSGGLSTLGRMTEAAWIDSLGGVTGGTRALTGEQIDAVVPKGQSRCDAILADNGQWVLIEMWSKAPRTEEVSGDPGRIGKRVAAYLRKLEQAEATKRHLGAIARRYGLIPPRDVATVLVANDPIAGSNALLAAIQSLRPDRNPRVIVSADELRQLVSMSGPWSGPGLVLSWQSSGLPALGLHLDRLARWTGVREQPIDERWRDLIPFGPALETASGDTTEDLGSRTGWSASTRHDRR